MARQDNIPSVVLVSLALQEHRGAAGLLQFCLEILDLLSLFSSCEGKEQASDHETQPWTWRSSQVTDLFVGPTCHNSSPRCLSQPCCVWVCVSHWLPVWERWDRGRRLGECVRRRFSQIWQAVDSWTAGSSFSSQRGWNFSPWKSRVINDLASQNNLAVYFFFFFSPPFPYFSCPSSFVQASPRLRQALVW